MGALLVGGSLSFRFRSKHPEPVEGCDFGLKTLVWRPVALYRRRASALCDKLRVTAVSVLATLGQNLPQN
jgi:hypothetical protein